MRKFGVSFVIDMIMLLSKAIFYVETFFAFWVSEGSIDNTLALVRDTSGRRIGNKLSPKIALFPPNL